MNVTHNGNEILKLILQLVVLENWFEYSRFIVIIYRINAMNFWENMIF